MVVTIKGLRGFSNKNISKTLLQAQKSGCTDRVPEPSSTNIQVIQGLSVPVSKMKTSNNNCLLDLTKILSYRLLPAIRMGYGVQKRKKRNILKVI